MKRLRSILQASDIPAVAPVPSVPSHSTAPYKRNNLSVGMFSEVYRQHREQGVKLYSPVTLYEVQNIECSSQIDRDNEEIIRDLVLKVDEGRIEELKQERAKEYRKEEVTIGQGELIFPEKAPPTSTSKQGSSRNTHYRSGSHSPNPSRSRSRSRQRSRSRSRSKQSYDNNYHSHSHGRHRSRSYSRDSSHNHSKKKHHCNNIY